MIDKITLIKDDLTPAEKLQVIEKNNLQSFVNEATGVHIYTNQHTKNLTGGILLKITNATLKIEGSIHKYYNWITSNILENYNIFKMADFLKTIESLFEKYSLPNTGYILTNYEIGLNIQIQKGEPKDYLKKVTSIGNLDGTQRKIYVNPKYKHERFLCTQMHKDNTLVFRIYDKNFERIDKGRKFNISPTIRIETLRTRQKIKFSAFCQPANLTILQNKFFQEWNKLNFDKEISAPAGTTQSKKDLAKKILLHGSIIALAELEERRNQLTPKIFRNAKTFIKNWESVKLNYTLIPCEIAPIWAACYNSAIQLVTDCHGKI